MLCLKVQDFWITRSDGLSGMQTMATLGVPYAMLLYERFLGRPFAGHRDSVSELVGDSLEAAIEDVLTHSGISYRKTKRAERIAGFDQAPDTIDNAFFQHDAQAQFDPETHIDAGFSIDKYICATGSNTLLEGIRGTGKTHILKMIFKIESYANILQKEMLNNPTNNPVQEH